jgi:hypothetical protein
MGDELFDMTDEVTRVVVEELTATYGEPVEGNPREMSAVLETKHVNSVIRYVRDEGLVPTDGNDLAVLYLIKHLYGILLQAG